MISSLYHRILTSKLGSRIFQIDFNKESDIVINWTETGVYRFVFLNIFFFVAATRLVLHHFLMAVDLRSLIIILFLSLYLSQKTYLIFAKVLDVKDYIEIEFSKPLEEKAIFNVLEDIMNGVKPIKAIKQNSID